MAWEKDGAVWEEDGGCVMRSGRYGEELLWGNRRPKIASLCQDG